MAPTKAPTKASKTAAKRASRARKQAPPAEPTSLADVRADRAATGADPAGELAWELAHLPIDQVHPDPNQPRSDVGDIDELTASIQSLGILEPLLVSPATNGTGGWRIIAGERRWTAAAKAGLVTVPCIIREDLAEGLLEHTGDVDSRRLEAQLVENLQRADLSPIDEARTYQRLLDTGLSQRKLAERIGRNQSHISKRLKLLALPSQYQTDLAEGTLTVDDGLQLARLAEHPERVAAAVAAAAPDLPDWQRATITEAVEEQLEEVTRDERRRAAVEQLDEAGMRILDWKDGHTWPKGHRRLDQSWKWPHGKAPSKTKVERAGHLAAAVDPYGEIVYVCTNAKAHEHKPRNTGGAGADTADDDDEAAKVERRQKLALSKRRKAEAAARVEAAARFVRHSGRRDEIDSALDEAISADGRLGPPTSIFVRSILHTWLDLIGSVWSEPVRTAYAVLGIEPSGYADLHSLRRLAAEPEYSGQVERAVWVALAEQCIAQGRLVDPLVTAYYRWLSAIRPAYEPTADELAELRDALEDVASTAKAS